MEAASTESRQWTRTRDQAVQSPTTFRYRSTMYMCVCMWDRSSCSGVGVGHIWTQQLSPTCTVVEHMGSLHPDGHWDRLRKIYGLIQPYWAFSLMPRSICCACQWLETGQGIRTGLLCVSTCSKCVLLSVAEPTVHFVHHRQTQRRRPHKGRRNAGLWENQGALCHRHRQGNKQLCPWIGHVNLNQKLF